MYGDSAGGTKRPVRRELAPPAEDPRDEVRIRSAGEPRGSMERNDQCRGNGDHHGEQDSNELYP